MIFDGSVEIVDGYIVPELLLGHFAALDRSSGESDTRCVGKETQHVVGQDTVVRAVCLVGEDHDLVVGMNRLPCRGVELVYQGEQELVVALEPFGQFLAARRHQRLRLNPAEASAGLECLTDLLVQLFTVRDNEECRRTARLAEDLAGEEYHRVAFARPLRVPEHAKLAAVFRALQVALVCAVDAQVLVVARQNLEHLAVALVEQDEVLHDVQQVLLLANTVNEFLETDFGDIVFAVSLPLPEELPI